ncbi:3-hydroxybutyryl-CoA dehydrogenase [Lacibacter cauensis]|uniref:3-hydroxybutyryl-CoA dehydrogenase n=1 Tax=Lacibacter cauensis TaxID=510947 RepID=A0A562SQF9_9BACT|nr:3-hydroxyacyl-CoA dehydrogenase family protein [Lacibacter cauensis]TWI83487.1 3-hydroxybutyryl-CoA dehydrogenase [Lacibacter cauensis]
MNILLISSGICNTLFGKSFPFDGFQCHTKQEVKADDIAFADFIIDLDFEENPQRINLYQPLNKPVLIGSVVHTLKDLAVQPQQPIARFNHWPVFINRPVVEFAVHPSHRSLFEDIFQQLSVSFYSTADTPGFVSARTVSMIINEAFLAKEEKVSAETEIDTAMQLGTGYPMGPFEWSKQTGVKRIASLLQKLSATDQRYQPASSLLNQL